MAKGDEKAVSDAAFSNAGDDFHLLWGALKALELVRPKSGLTAILPEAPTPRDAHRLDPSGQKLLSIDMTEYFGGSDFSSATTIAYSQLKYSSTRPNANFAITRTYVWQKQTESRTVQLSGSWPTLLQST